MIIELQYSTQGLSNKEGPEAKLYYDILMKDMLRWLWFYNVNKDRIVQICIVSLITSTSVTFQVEMNTVDLTIMKQNTFQIK